MTVDRPRSGEHESDAPVDVASFVAWLANRLEDEATRRRCRRVVETYLEWMWADGGPVATRPSRFVPAATRWLQMAGADVEQALDLLAEYRAVVAQTLPTDR